MAEAVNHRPSWESYFLNVADAVSARADCTRRQVGAVVVDPTTKYILATGYNGSPPGEPGCLSDGACPRGRHHKVMNYGTLDYGYHCAECGPKIAWPCTMSVAPGSSYDTGTGKCIALHAEQNATIRAGERARGAWMFVTDEPCDGCWKLLKGAGYSHIIWHGGQWTSGVPASSLKLWTCMLALDRIVRRWFSRSGKPTRS